MRFEEKIKENIEIGETVSVDEKVKTFEEIGFEAEYLNIAEGNGWCWTVLTVKDGKNIVDIPIELNSEDWIVKDLKFDTIKSEETRDRDVSINVENWSRLKYHASIEGKGVMRFGGKILETIVRVSESL